MTTLSNPKGINSRSVIDVPAVWSADWFRQFIRTQLANADVRNAVTGTGIEITGNSTTAATVSVTPDLQALFTQPYILAKSPSGISGAFDTFRILAPQSGVLTVTDGGAEASITVGVKTNGIGNAQIRQGAPISVIGNASDITANVADIASSANGDVLWNNGGTSIGFGPLTFLGTVTTGIWNATTIAAVHGGTGQNVYVVGDLLYASSTTALSRLADVAAGSYLRAGGVGTAPVWSTVAIPNAATIGDLWYGSAANAISVLSGNTSAVKQFLTQTGTGSASQAPIWGTIAASDLPSTLTSAITAPAFIPNGSSIPSNGIYLPAANNLGFAVNGAGAAVFNSSGVLTINSPAVGSTNTLVLNAVDATHNCLGIKGVASGQAGIGFFPNNAFAGQIGMAAVANQLVTGSGAGDFCIDCGSNALRVSTNGGASSAVVVATTGGMTVAAPSSGDAVTVSNVAGANALVVAGNAAGTPVVRFNTQVTTGAQTATFTAANKPGTGTTAPTKWLPINADGTTYYVPLWT